MPTYGTKLRGLRERGRFDNNAGSGNQPAARATPMSPQGYSVGSRQLNGLRGGYQNGGGTGRNWQQQAMEAAFNLDRTKAQDDSARKWAELALEQRKTGVLTEAGMRSHNLDRDYKLGTLQNDRYATNVGLMNSREGRTFDATKFMLEQGYTPENIQDAYATGQLRDIGRPQMTQKEAIALGLPMADVNANMAAQNEAFAQGLPQQGRGVQQNTGPVETFRSETGVGPNGVPYARMRGNRNALKNLPQGEAEQQQRGLPKGYIPVQGKNPVYTQQQEENRLEEQKNKAYGMRAQSGGKPVKLVDPLVAARLKQQGIGIPADDMFDVGQVTETANYYIENGMDPDAAIRQAAQDLGLPSARDVALESGDEQAVLGEMDRFIQDSTQTSTPQAPAEATQGASRGLPVGGRTNVPASDPALQIEEMKTSLESTRKELRGLQGKRRTSEEQKRFTELSKQVQPLEEKEKQRKELFGALTKNKEYREGLFAERDSLMGREDLSEEETSRLKQLVYWLDAFEGYSRKNTRKGAVKRKKQSTNPVL